MFATGQKKIDPAGREAASSHTVARVDTERCVTSGDSEDNRGCAWIAVIAPERDQLTDIYAKQLAERYYLNGSDGGICGSYGPVPDSAGVTPPGPVDQAPGREMTLDEYEKTGAVAALNHDKKRYVCFYLVRRANA